MKIVFRKENENIDKRISDIAADEPKHENINRKAH